MDTYDVHITVDKDSFESYMIQKPWQVHDIQNVQGIPRLIVSLRYTGVDPHTVLDEKVKEFQNQGVWIFRRKIELHFEDIHDVVDGLDGIVEIHYKLKAAGLLSVSQEQICELDQIGVAISFNKEPERRIISARFEDIESYMEGSIVEKFPEELESMGKELVTFDSNPDMDYFWPLRSTEFPVLSFMDFPRWAVKEGVTH